MSAPQHAPGPWAICDLTGNVWAPNAGDDDIVCEPPSEDAPLSRGRWPANARLITAALDLKGVAENFEFRGPDDDGLVWLILHGNGTTGRAMVNLGPAGGVTAQVALHLEHDRRAAIAKAEGR